MDFLTLFLSTIRLRPYVFACFAIFLTSAIRSWGWRRSFAFTILAWGIAFSAEYASTRIGFPFGLYSYIQETGEEELWIANIPFMDSLSFTFLAYASYTLTLHLLSPSTNKGRLWKPLLLSTVLFVLLDVVIDPLALRGDRWFLGKIYGYPEGGIYFGVPLSNFLGWAVVGFTIVFLFQRIDHRIGGVLTAARLPGLGGPFLYFAILLSGIGLTFLIDELLLGTIGLLLSLAPLSLFLRRLLERPSWSEKIGNKARPAHPVIDPLRRSDG